MGRPTLFTKDLADYIAARIAEGETLRALCRDDPVVPDRATVSQWIATKPDFADQVARAREAASHLLVEETREIADDGNNDWMEKRGRDGQSIGWQLNGEHVQRSRLRIEQRWREAEAILPKVYGKRQMIEHSGSIAVTDGKDDELVQEMLELLATGRLKLPGGVVLAEGEEREGEDDDFSDIA